MYFILIIIIFLLLIVLPGMKKQKEEINKVNNIKFANEKVLFVAKKNPYVSLAFLLYIIIGYLMTFLGIAAFFDSGVEQLYHNLTEDMIFLLRIGTILGVSSIIRGFYVYLPIEKNSKFDMLLVTDKRILYNKISENYQLKELLPNAIINVFVRRNSNSFSKALVIETENEIITFPCFEDVDNLNNILNSVIKSKNISI